MTDPKAQEEMAPPPKPPRPALDPSQLRQMEADEMYARQLSEHYNQSRRRAQPPGWETDPRYQNARGSDESDERREYSFFDGRDLDLLPGGLC